MRELWTVLRTGREYGVHHVAWLKHQLARHAPGAQLVCLSNVETSAHRTVALQHDWPGWWSKMELFRPDIPGDILYCDLDTVLIGPLDDAFAVSSTTVLRDFFWKTARDKNRDSVGSGLMFLTEEDRAAVWKEWSRDPRGWRKRAGGVGDQRVIETIIGAKAQRWQDVLPGQVISYKADIVRPGLTQPPAGANIVCFHGQPRPWTVKDGWARDSMFDASASELA